MQTFRVRVWLTESYFNDIPFTAENWFSAVNLGKGMSPIGRAVLL